MKKRRSTEGYTFGDFRVLDNDYRPPSNGKSGRNRGGRKEEMLVKVQGKQSSRVRIRGVSSSITDCHKQRNVTCLEFGSGGGTRGD